MICFECDGPAECQHHVIPRSLGGMRTVPLCLVCHGKIHGKSALGGGELIKRKLQHLKATGQRYTRIIPFGYELGTDGKSLVENPIEQEAILLMCELRALGETLRGIAAELERRGIKPRNGGRQWRPQVIRDILNRAAERNQSNEKETLST